MFLLTGIEDFCLKASIFFFAIPNIMVCTLEHSCLQVWTVERWRFQFHGERCEGENGALRMVFLGLVRSGIFNKDRGWGTGEKGGRSYGSEVWVPWINDFRGCGLVGWWHGCWKSNRMSPQLYTVGWTTLEPLSPWCPTSQKATGASTTQTQESRVSQWDFSLVSFPLLDLKTQMTTFRLLCIDLPGHGLSSHIPPGSLWSQHIWFSGSYGVV